MVKTKVINLKMKNGKTRKQKVQVLKNGQYKFLKNKGTKKKSTSKKKTTTKKKTTNRKKKVVKKKPTGGRKMGKRWYAGPILGAVAYPAANALGLYFGDLTWDQALGNIIAGYVVFNPITGELQWHSALMNYGAIGAGTAASWLAGKFGLNRKLPFNI